MEKRRKSLRFGLMVNSLTVEQWQYDTIKTLMDNNMKLSLIIQKNDISTSPSSHDKSKINIVRHFIFKIWKRFVIKSRSRIPADIDDLTKDIPTIFCTPMIRRGISYFREIDIQEIRNQNLDFILQLGFNIIAGEVINTTKYGIWTFNHGESRDKIELPGFWEFMEYNHTNVVGLQKLSGVKEKEIILKEIKLKTILHSYRAQLEQSHFESTTLPLQVCKDLIEKGWLEEKVIVTDDDENNIPSNFNMIQYFMKSVWRRIAFHINDLFRQEDWNVGYCDCTIEKFIDTDNKENFNIQWFKKPKKNCYFADPFVIKTKNNTYIFFEWYSYSNGKADLAVVLKTEGYKIFHKISDFKEHRSYPFVFEHKDVIYCLPEANATNQLVLYRFDENKLALEKDCVLLEGFPIVDATLHYHDNKWYMFLVNQKKSHTHLEIFYSDNLKGTYKPHHNNPVMIDCSKARPAGKIFNYHGKTIRPSQNCTRHYGQSITLEEIDILTEREFVTKAIGEIYPVNESEYDEGIHTINSDGNITVFDGKRFVFTISGFKQQLKQKIYK